MTFKIHPGNATRPRREMKGLAMAVMLVSVLLSCSHEAPITVPLYSARLEPPELSSKSRGVSPGFTINRPNEIVIIPDGIADPSRQRQEHHSDASFSFGSHKNMRKFETHYA